MKTPSKIAITLCLIFVALAKIKGQQKYEFMSISYYYAPTSQEIMISMNGTEFLKEKVKLEKGEYESFNTNPLLKKVQEYQEKNWELLSFTSVSAGTRDAHIAYLRKRKE